MRATRALGAVCASCTRTNYRTLQGRNSRGIENSTLPSQWITARRTDQKCRYLVKPFQTQRRTLFTARYDDSTIYALSTAPGRAAIAIIRISGPACLDIYRSLCPGRPDPRPRYATLRTLYEPNAESQNSAQVLDAEALVLYFPPPHTVTGEALLELHIHGGTATVRAVLAAIPKSQHKQQEKIQARSRIEVSTSAIRPAEPGEFTRRAFHNNRLSLPQIEALADALSATTEQQRRLAVRGASTSSAATSGNTNNLTARYETWRHALLAARGELEALIDFAEDGDFESSSTSLIANIARQIQSLLRMLRAHVTNANKGELLRSGIRIALLGAPNAGKSSLLNSVVGREAAIVSSTEGTTRDVVEVGLDLGGFLVRVGDTAGLRRDGSGGGKLRVGGPVGGVEREGMRRARNLAGESDVVVVVLSFEAAAEAGSCVGKVAVHYDPEVISTAAELVRTKGNVIVVINKSDLFSSEGGGGASREDVIRITQQHLPGLDSSRIHFTSCRDTSLTLDDDADDRNNEDDSIPRISTPSFSLSWSSSSWSSSSEDAGGIQSFLTALISHFETLTTAISSIEPSDLSVPADPSIWQESLGATNRQRVLLEQCIAHLEDFLKEVRQSGHELRRDSDGTGGEGEQRGFEPDIVLAAEHLRGAAGCLARITGRGDAGGGGDVEEVLGVVFEKFCVGK